MSLALQCVLERCDKPGHPISLALGVPYFPSAFRRDFRSPFTGALENA